LSDEVWENKETPLITLNSFADRLQLI